MLRTCCAATGAFSAVIGAFDPAAMAEALANPARLKIKVRADQSREAE
jgi:hypothetical protein